MESLNRPGTNAGRAVHVRRIVVSAMLAFAIPGILSGQTAGADLTKPESVKVKTGG